jgi:thioredoxin reductase (NADPH)
MSADIQRTTLVIIGAGPAGLAAAVDAQNSRLDFIIVDHCDPAYIPKIMINQHFTTDGYLGFHNHTGTQLQEEFLKHIESKNIGVIRTRVEQISTLNRGFVVTHSIGKIYCKYLIIATGIKPNKLNIDGFDRYFGKNIFFFADVDGKHLVNKRIGVIGGRDSGVTAALYFFNLGNEVLLFEKKETLTASKKYQDRLIDKGVQVSTGVSDIKILDKEKFYGIKITREQTVETIALDYLFVYVGMSPVTDLLSGLPIKTDDNNCIQVNAETMESSIANLYAAGDITQLLPKQISNATAHGKTAV